MHPYTIASFAEQKTCFVTSLVEGDAVVHKKCVITASEGRKGHTEKKRGEFMFLRSLKFSLFENSIQREEEGTSEEGGEYNKGC